MGSFEIPGWSDDTVARHRAALEDLAARYRSDPRFRVALDADPQPGLLEAGFRFPPGVQVKIAADTDVVMHFVLPADPNAELSDEMLEAIAGGDVGSLGCAQTLVTVACSSILSSAATQGSMGTHVTSTP